MLKEMIVVLALATPAFSQTTRSSAPEIPASVIAQWEAAQPALKKNELATIPKAIARHEQRLHAVASSPAKTPAERQHKRELVERERDGIAALRARRNSLLRDPTAVSYGSLGELKMGTVGVPERMAEFKVVQVIGENDMLVDYWSADTVGTLFRRDGAMPDEDSTPIRDLPASDGFGDLLTIDSAKSVWLSGIPTNGLADGDWLPEINIPLFVAGTRQFKTAAGGSRTVVYIVKFPPPATQSSGAAKSRSEE